MRSAKQKIIKCVEDYIKIYPEDYQIVVDGISMKRKMLKTEYAEIEGMTSEMRGAFEIPEDLSNMFLIQLDEEEMKWFKEGGPKGHDGSYWFQTTFPVFALPSKI